MTILSFILILCAIAAAGFGVSRVTDLTLKHLLFAIVVICTILFFLVAAGVVGTYPLHI